MKTIKRTVTTFEFNTHEICPECEEEVELIQSVQECPNCKKVISACSMCDIENCLKCEHGSNFKINPLAQEDLSERIVKFKIN